MSLKDWENRHSISTEGVSMSQRKLKVLLNIGTDDQKRYGIPNSPGTDEPPREGDVISVEEKIANVLVNVLHVAKDYDESAEREHAEAVRKADERRMETFNAMQPGQATARIVKSQDFNKLDERRVATDTPAEQERLAAEQKKAADEQAVKDKSKSK